MQKYIKNAGIILGHLICIVILTYCFANSNAPIDAEKNMVHTVAVPSSKPTKEPTAVPAATSTSVPTTAPTATSTPAPTTAPTATSIPTPTIIAAIIPTSVPAPTEEPAVELATEWDILRQTVKENIASGVYSALSNYSDSWWFKRKENHKPSGTGEIFDISDYQGVYINKQPSEDDKVVYLTIDCGYGSDNTAVLLDIFKEENIHVTFFVTGHFLKKNPEEVRRMSEEGHSVGNHSVTHPDLTILSDEEIYAEIVGCEEKYFEITGKQMDLLFRPPGGDYSKRTMQIAKDLGYLSVFWSIAYYDYDKDNQPGKEYVLNHFEQYHHNGAIILMHNDSDSNRDAMRDVITYLKEQGYRFGSLEELRQ